MIFQRKQKKGRRRPTALVVEDDRDSATLTQRALRRLGYDCDVCDTSEMAWAFIRKKAPALVVLDVGLPTESGLNLLHMLRCRADTASVLVFMLTARSRIGEMERAFRMGANEYIMKPIPYERLLSTLRRGLSRRGLLLDAPA